MSISNIVFGNMAKFRDWLKSMLPGQQPRIGDPVDCELPVTIDEVFLADMAEDLGQQDMVATVKAFARDLNETAGKMRTQLRAGDSSGVRRSAHRMKGLFSQFGASEQARLAAKLEAHEAEEMGATAARLLDCVPAIIAAVQRATRTAKDTY
jgi:HPt (histidine-containing phosphotransfer) domain-containing protein